MLSSSCVCTHTHISPSTCIGLLFKHKRARHVQVVFAIRIARFSSFPLFNPVRKVAFISFRIRFPVTFSIVYLFYRVVCRNRVAQKITWERPWERPLRFRGRNFISLTKLSRNLVFILTTQLRSCILNISQFMEILYRDLKSIRRYVKTRF